MSSSPNSVLRPGRRSRALALSSSSCCWPILFTLFFLLMILVVSETLLSALSAA